MNTKATPDTAPATLESSTATTEAATIATLGSMALGEHKISQTDLNGGLRALIVNGEIVDLTRLWNHDPKRLASFQTGNIESFCGFVKQHAAAIAQVFVNDVYAECPLDFWTHAADGTPQYGHLRHIASLTLEPSPSFRALCRLAPIDGKAQMHKQADFIELVEDYAEHFVAVGAVENNKSEAPTEALDARRLVSIARAIRIVETAQTDSEVTATGASRSRLEKIDAGSPWQMLPSVLFFRFQRASELHDQIARVRLRVLPGPNGAPHFACRLLNADELAQSWRDNLVNRISDTLRGLGRESMQVLLGSYDNNR